MRHVSVASCTAFGFAVSFSTRLSQYAVSVPNLKSCQPWGYNYSSGVVYSRRQCFPSLLLLLYRAFMVAQRRQNYFEQYARHQRYQDRIQRRWNDEPLCRDTIPFTCPSIYSSCSSSPLSSISPSSSAYDSILVTDYGSVNNNDRGICDRESKPHFEFAKKTPSFNSEFRQDEGDQLVQYDHDYNDVEGAPLRCPGGAASSHHNDNGKDDGDNDDGPVLDIDNNDNDSGGSSGGDGGGGDGPRDLRLLAAGAFFGTLIVGGAIVAGTGTVNTQTFLSLAQWFESLGPKAIFLYAGLYFLLELVAVPAVPLTLGSGYLFGVLRGTIAVSISSTAAASAAFLIARYGLRGAMSQIASRYPRFRAIDRAIARQGFKFVFLLRLSPLLPFSISNYLYGLTSINFLQFLIASWAGMLPGTIAYVSAGAAVNAITDIGTGQATKVSPYLLILGIVGTVGALTTIGKLASGAISEVTEHESSRDDPTIDRE